MCSNSTIFSKLGKEKNMSKWKCRVCGYIYDPANGDPGNGIKAGTAFEDLPGDWVCPNCGADKSSYDKID